MYLFSMGELLDLYNKMKYRRLKVNLQMNIYYNYYNYKLYALLSNYTIDFFYSRLIIRLDGCIKYLLIISLFW
jgi:hypothetical protein